MPGFTFGTCNKHRDKKALMLANPSLKTYTVYIFASNKMSLMANGIKSKEDHQISDTQTSFCIGRGSKIITGYALAARSIAGYVVAAGSIGDVLAARAK